MDIDSEKESGLDLCREMPSMSGVPAFISAAQKCDRHKVNALDAGADDYIVKPLAMQEFLARIRAVLWRKSSESEHPIFISNNLTIDCEQRTECVAGKVMRLLLRLLVEYVGKPPNHRRLLQAMCGSQYGSQSKYLRVVVCQLRKNVEVNPRYPKFICTDPWFGYHFAL